LVLICDEPWTLKKTGARRRECMVARYDRMGVVADGWVRWMKCAPLVLEVEEGTDGQVAGEVGWGEAVEGVRVGLRAKKAIWQGSEYPVFTIDLESEEERTLPHYGPPIHAFEVMVDGKWYERTSDFFEGLKSVGDSSGKERELHFSLAAKHWRRKDDGARMSLRGGRHVLRVAYLFSSAEGGNAELVRAISNPVEIEILPTFEIELLSRVELDRAERTWKAEVRRRAAEEVRVELRGAVQVWGRSDWADSVVRLTVDARNDGAYRLHLPRNGQSWQVEVDGVWYERVENPGGVLLDFASGDRHEGLTVEVAGGWRRIPEGKELEYARRWYGSGFAVMGEQYGEALQLGPGEHRVRVAITCPPSRAGQDIVAIRSVSNLVEIEIVEWKEGDGEEVGPISAPDRWTRVLPDGGVVQLVGLFRPKDDPIVFWDPNGTIIEGPKLARHDFANASRHELAYVLRRPETRYENGHENPAPDGHFYDVHGWKTFRLESDEALIIKRGSGYGEWGDMGQITEGEDSGGYKLTEVEEVDNRRLKQIRAKMFWNFDPEFGIRLVAVDRRGKEYPMEAGGRILGDFYKGQQMLYYQGAVGLTKKELSHFKLQRRPLAWATFEGFAREPRVAAGMPAEVLAVIASLKAELEELLSGYPELGNAGDIRIRGPVEVAGLHELAYLHDCKYWGKRGYEDTGPHPVHVTFSVVWRPAQGERFPFPISDPIVTWPNLNLVGWVHLYVGEGGTPGIWAKIREVLDRHVEMMNVLERRAAEGEGGWGEAVEGLRVGVSVKKSRFAMDEPIEVRWQIKNVGQEDKTIIWHRLHYSPVVFEIGKSGEKKYIREDSRRMFNRALPGPPETLILKVGETKEATFDLRYFGLDSAAERGTYEVTGMYSPKDSRQLADDWLKRVEFKDCVTGPIRSAPVRIAITEDLAWLEGQLREGDFWDRLRAAERLAPIVGCKGSDGIGHLAGSG